MVGVITTLISTGCDDFRRWRGGESPVYYFPDIETFMRLIPSPSKDSLYIVLNKTSIPDLSDSADFIRIKKMTSCSDYYLHFNPIQNEIIVTAVEYPHIADLHLIHYSGTVIGFRNELYYDCVGTGYVFKYPFYCVNIYSTGKVVSTQKYPGNRKRFVYPIESYRLKRTSCISRPSLN